MIIKDIQCKRDFTFIQGHYYTLLFDSFTGDLQIVDSKGNYYNVGRGPK